MAGPRNHIPSHALGLRGQTDEQRYHHRALVEERIAAQERGIQTLLLDNQRLAATHVALKQELAAAQKELLCLSATAESIKAERDVQVREVFDGALKMESEIRLMENASSELDQVILERKELTAKLQGIESDLVRASSEPRNASAIQTEFELMHRENERGRAAIEHEKKTRESNERLWDAMERTLISMARKREKLRSELADSEKQAHVSAAVSSPGGYGGNSYPAPHAIYNL